MVRIRMSRQGRPHRPFYRINAVDARSKRDGRVIEALGWYDPMTTDPTKTMQINAERVKYWVSVGAQPSGTVRDFLAKNNLVNVEAWNSDRAEQLEARKKGAEKRAALATAAAEKKDAKAEPKKA